MSPSEQGDLPEAGAGRDLPHGRCAAGGEEPPPRVPPACGAAEVPGGGDALPGRPGAGAGEGPAAASLPAQQAALLPHQDTRACPPPPPPRRRLLVEPLPLSGQLRNYRYSALQIRPNPNGNRRIWI